MTWTAPPYLRTALIQSREIHYEWDEGDLRWIYSRPRDLDLNALPWASWVDAAICGLTIASLEWVVFRLQPFDTDRTPSNGIEAAWCANIDRHYCEALEFSQREWKGPIRGALVACLNIMNEALYECPEAGSRPLHTPLLAANLVQHICKDSKDRFEAWREQIINRFSTFFQAPDPLNDLYGVAAGKMVVPPQALDPEIRFDSTYAPELADQFLRSVNYQENALLNTPAQMLKDGFTGTPYRYP